MTDLKIVIATRNSGKVKEFRYLFEEIDAELLAVGDLAGLVDVEETGTSFEENAVIKASETARATGYISIADDSGLVVDALNGEPGIRSARYAGENATDSENIKKLLSSLHSVPFEKRTAYFVSVVAAATQSGQLITATGKCSGYISLEKSGNGGFGYDPVFYMPEYKCTMAEISIDIKNSISHRALAVMKFKKLLPEFIASAV